VANALRLLENWRGKQLTHRGSLAVLYYSEIADGPYDPTVYSAPFPRVFVFTNLFQEISLGSLASMREATRKKFRRSEPKLFESGI
jgi:hypothetical protein